MIASAAVCVTRTVFYPKGSTPESIMRMKDKTIRLRCKGGPAY